MKRLLIVSAALALSALAFPLSASADDDVLRYCDTTATGWERWVDDDEYACSFARDAYRKTRRVQRQRGGFRPGERFTIYKRFDPPVRGLVIAWSDVSSTIRLRERGHGIVAEFTHA